MYNQYARDTTGDLDMITTTIIRVTVILILFAALTQADKIYDALVVCDTDTECYNYCLRKTGSNEEDCADILKGK